MAFPALGHKTSNNFPNYPHSKEATSSSFTNDLPQDISSLTNMFHGMLSFEKKYNKERTLKNKKVVCFACQNEGHTIHTCYKVFPKLKERSDEGNQERKPRYQKDGYKNKKKVTPTQASRMRAMKRKSKKMKTWHSWP